MLIFYMLVLTLPLTQHWLLGSSFGGLTLEKILGLLCIPLALAHVATRGKFHHPLCSAGTLSCVAYFIVSFMLGAATSDLTWDSLLLQNNVLSIFLFFVVTVLLVDDMRRVRNVALLMVGSVTLASVYTIREWLGNRSFSGYRPGGISGDANYFGACAAASLALGFVLMRSQLPRYIRFFLLGSFVITLLAFTLAASRGGLVGLTFGFGLVIYRSRQRFRNLILAGFLLIPILLVAPNSPFQRLISPNYGDETAVTARRIAWQAGLRMIQDHPLTGVGLGHFRLEMPKYSDSSAPIEVVSVAHNTYLEVAAEQGLVGFSLFIATLISSYFGLGRLARLTSSADPPWFCQLCTGLQVAIVALCVSAFFISAWWMRFFWLPMFLGISMQAIVKTVVDEEPTAFAAEA